MVKVCETNHVKICYKFSNSPAEVTVNAEQREINCIKDQGKLTSVCCISRCAVEMFTAETMTLFARFYDMKSL